MNGGASRSRTEVHGFAIRCIATLPTRLNFLDDTHLMVPRAGLEPAQRERRGILNPLCLPIPPPGQRNHAMVHHHSNAVNRWNEAYFNQLGAKVN